MTERQTKSPAQHTNVRAEAEWISQLTSVAGFVDNRPAVATLRSLSEMLHNSPRMAAQRKLTETLNNSPRMLAQRKLMDRILAGPEQRKGGQEEEDLPQGQFAPVQRTGRETDSIPRKNDTGLPDRLKAGIETLSGISLDNVKIHYNSSQPAQLDALAYAQGSDIHVAPGQARHLPHEAWHVVQQARGRVQPTMQMKNGVPVNADQGLEQEANVMGARAAVVGQFVPSPFFEDRAKRLEPNPRRTPISGQGKGHVNFQTSIEPTQLIRVELGSPAPVQRTLLGVDGSVEDKYVARTFFNTLARDNAQIRAMRDDESVQVYINVQRSEGGGDARTVPEWRPRHQKSLIMIELDLKHDETASDMKATLLHELILHAIPAYEKHLAARGGDPRYTDPEVDEDLFDQEEAAEHGDVARWQEVITHGAQYGQAVWIETCRDLVRHLGVQNELGERVCSLLQAYDPDFAALYLENESEESESDSG